MSAHIHAYTYIHTHIQNVYMNAHKHAWNDGAAANVQGAVADQGSIARLSFDAIKPYFAPPIQRLHCTHVLQHQYPSCGAAERKNGARRNLSPRMIKVTVHEKRRVNEEQPTPASSPLRKSRERGAQTTPAHLHWCGANPPSSWPTHVASSGVDRCSDIGSHFHHFPTVFKYINVYIYT